MCNKNLRLKTPLKVNRPLELILTFPFFEERGGGGEGLALILNLIFRTVG